MLKTNSFQAVSLLVFTLSGCASTSVFNPYPNQAAEYKAAITNGTIDDVTPKLLSKQKSNDGLLYAQESGRLHQLNHQFEASKADFDHVYESYEKVDDKAIVSATSAASGTASFLTNDNALPYTGYGFERIMALHSQAFNYLGLGDIEGASVEIRRAALEQRILEVAHEKELSKADENARSKNVDTSFWKNSPELAGMSKIAGKVKSSFQNAYTFYTSAVIWEAMGDLNAALVDYKKALEINPDSTTILKDIERISANKKIKYADEGHLVVLFEDGFVPARQSFKLPIPYLTGQSATYSTISFPYYPGNNWYQARSLTIFNNNSRLGSTEVVAQIGSMAVKSLQENIPGMIVRMVIRARAKHELHQQATKEGGAVGSILSTLYNVVSEQPDLRNWLTLPHNAQIFRTAIIKGEHNIELVMSGMSRTENIKIQSGKITILRVINANNRLITQQFQL